MESVSHTRSNTRPATPRQRPSKRALAIVEDLSGGEHALTDIAARHAMTVASLARWAARPRNLQLLEQTRDLALLRAALVAARARTDATLSLRRVALNHENIEIARRASADLLRLCAPPFDIQPPNPRFQPENRENTLRALMEELGTNR